MAAKESTFFNMLTTLLVISGVSAFALGAVYNVTKEPIANVVIEKKKEAIKMVLPAFDELKPEQSITPEDGVDMVKVTDAYKAGKYIGSAVETYTDKGFAGRIAIMVGFLADGSIYNTAVIAHKETPGLGDKMDVSKSDFPLQFKGKNPSDFKLVVKKDGGDVDAITAATISSRAFCDAVQRGYTIIENKGGQQ